MQGLVEFLVFALGQMAEHQDVIQHASVFGAVLTTVFAVFRFLRAQSQSPYNFEAGRGARPRPQAPAVSRSASNLDVAVADLKEMMRVEARRNLAYGFVQNLFFFILGTITSILLQGVA